MTDSVQGTWTLWYPITLAPGRTIGLGPEGSLRFSVAGQEVELRADGRSVTFTVSGLPDQEAARAWMARLRRGCLWAMLQCQTSFVAETQLSDVTFRENWEQERGRPVTILGKEYPEGLDGLADASRPHVYPDGVRLGRIKMGGASVELGTAGERFVAEVARGASMGADTGLPGRLETGLALFAAADHEASATARFLTRVMALEAMVAPRMKHDAVVAMVERWMAELRARLGGDTTDDERASLVSLEGQMTYLREESIKSGIRRLVFSSLCRSDQGGAEAEAREAGRLYDARSRLVHDGVLDAETLSWAQESAKRICQSVLASCLELGLPFE